LFPELFSKPTLACFDQDLASSDGGALLLKAADRHLGLTPALGEALWDRRQPGKIKHLLPELLAQRIYAIACGYPDANDASRLGHDPIHKMLIDRDPATGLPLASQPTLSRFENTVTRHDLWCLGAALADQLLARHRRRLRRRVRHITLDLDLSHDPTHGQQELGFFHGHYDTYCSLPLFAFLTFNNEPEQYLCAALLRPGNAPDKRGVIALLRRILTRIREHFPKVRILVRLDGGFRAPEILASKELKDGLQIDRTSCTRFLANQLRVLMTAAAYVLMQELRLHLARTRARRYQVSTLREHLLKIGVRLVVSARRMVFRLPRSYPFTDLWSRLAVNLGAVRQ